MRAVTIVKEFSRESSLPSVPAGVKHLPGYAILPDESADALIAEGLAEPYAEAAPPKARAAKPVAEA